VGSARHLASRARSSAAAWPVRRCTVHLDGKVTRACITPISESRARRSPPSKAFAGPQHSVQKAWIEEDCRSAAIAIGQIHGRRRAPRTEARPPMPNRRYPPFRQTSPAAGAYAGIRRAIHLAAAGTRLARRRQGMSALPSSTAATFSAPAARRTDPGFHPPRPFARAQRGGPARAVLLTPKFTSPRTTASRRHHQSRNGAGFRHFAFHALSRGNSIAIGRGPHRISRRSMPRFTAHRRLRQRQNPRLLRPMRQAAPPRAPCWLQAAAAKWGVDASTLRPKWLRLNAAGARLIYGSLADPASHLPVPSKRPRSKTPGNSSFSGRP